MKGLCCRQAGLASEKFCYKAMMLTYVCSTFCFVLLKYRRPYLKRYHLHGTFTATSIGTISLPYHQRFMLFKSALIWRQMVPLLLSPEKAAPKFSKKKLFEILICQTVFTDSDFGAHAVIYMADSHLFLMQCHLRAWRLWASVMFQSLSLINWILLFYGS